MSAEFVPLADLVRPRVAPADVSAPEPLAVVPEATTADAAAPVVIDDVCADDLYEALRDARLFRARLADAFDAALARLLRELAADVLARELRLAPCDLHAIAQRIAASAPVVRLRVPIEAHIHAPGVEVVHDPQLRDGDAIVELDGGAIDARLGVRLALALEAMT